MDPQPHRDELTVTQLVHDAHNNAIDKGWHLEERRPAEIIALIHSELSEALECLRDGHDVKDIWLEDGGKPEGFGIELADAVIRIADYCGLMGIDLEDALHLKMTYNKSRPHRHGGKKL